MRHGFTPASQSMRAIVSIEYHIDDLRCMPEFRRASCLHDGRRPTSEAVARMSSARPAVTRYHGGRRHALILKPEFTPLLKCRHSTTSGNMKAHYGASCEIFYKWLCWLFFYHTRPVTRARHVYIITGYCRLYQLSHHGMRKCYEVIMRTRQPK